MQGGMGMERVSLTAERRTPNKGAIKKMRTTGRIPAVLYGRSIKPMAISVDKKQFEQATKTTAGMNVMIDLAVENADSGLAFIRDYQADPFKREFRHIDFQAISIDETIELEIPVELIGTPIGVKEGGVIVQPRHTIAIKTKPNNIPDKITVDITELDIGDTIHADDMKLPQGVEFTHATNFSVVAIVPPTKEEVPAAPPPVEVEAAAAAAAEAAVPAEGAAPEKKEPEKAQKEEKAKAK
jgi:large subunit ribosomal protein L25